METVLPADFKRGMVLMLDDTPHVLEDLHSSGTAQTRHKLHVRLRNLRTNRVIDRTFAENERVPVAQLQTRTVEFSFKQGDTFAFLDTETFEELDLPADLVGERRWFLKETQEYKALFLEEKFLDIVLPPQIPLAVAETAPPARGGSDSAWKEARLETGLQIMVPLFIAKGETVRVDTHEKKYAGKAN
jgi:elongation factor P